MDFQQAQNMVQQNNVWSAQQAQKQMDFQREMSNTAHQREVADLKAAGLNPVLSAKLGGASTPNGAMGDTDTSGTSTLIDMMMSSVGAAGSGAQAAESAVNGITGLVDNIIGALTGTKKQKTESLQNLWHYVSDHGDEVLAGVKNIFGGHNTNSAVVAQKENDGVKHGDMDTSWVYSPYYNGPRNPEDRSDEENQYLKDLSRANHNNWWFKTFFPEEYKWYLERRGYYSTMWHRGYHHGNRGGGKPNLMAIK